MARTTPELVRKIADIDAAVDLEPFITMANELVTEVCEPSGYSEARLELIERNLAAHNYHSLMEMKAEFESVRGIQERKQSKVDLGLNNTHYGQRAMELDTKGGLAALNSSVQVGSRTKATIGFSWLGTPHDESEL